MPSLTIYSNDACTHCRSAKRLLDQRGVRYDEVYVPMDDAGRELLFARTGGKTLPQVVIDGQPIGGYEELAQLGRRGWLSGAADPNWEYAA